MELVSAVLFINTVIIAITQAIKFLAPQVKGVITIVIAVVVGVLIALIDTSIGVDNISIAQGVLAGLSSVGIVTALKR